MDFAVSVDNRVKESRKTNKYLDLAREIKTQLNMRVELIQIVVSTLKMVMQTLKRRMWNLWANRKHLDYIFVVISYYTEKSPGDMTRFAVSQAQMEIHQLILVWKIREDRKNNNNYNHNNKTGIKGWKD